MRKEAPTLASYTGRWTTTASFNGRPCRAWRLEFTDTRCVEIERMRVCICRHEGEQEGRTLKHVHVDEELTNGGGRRRPEKRERTRRWWRRRQVEGCSLVWRCPWKHRPALVTSILDRCRKETPADGGDRVSRPWWRTPVTERQRRARPSARLGVRVWRFSGCGTTAATRGTAAAWCRRACGGTGLFRWRLDAVDWAAGDGVLPRSVTTHPGKYRTIA
jgi:hypothetical protein